MRDGGVYVLSIPLAPYRCPPGPYERASMIAAYLKQAKPRSKVLVLDANPDVTSKGGLFKAAWNDLYKGIIEYRGNAKAIGVDAADHDREARSRGREGRRAQRGAAAARGRHRAEGRADHRQQPLVRRRLAHAWNRRRFRASTCWATRRCRRRCMPKSGSMANNHAKIAAAAIVELAERPRAEPTPKILNTCYSFVSQKEAIRVSSVHQWDAARSTLVDRAGLGRRLGGAQRGRRHLRVELGPDHLGRFAG